MTHGDMKGPGGLLPFGGRGRVLSPWAVRPGVFGRRGELPVPSGGQGSKAQQSWIPTEQGGGHPVHPDPHGVYENPDFRASAQISRSDSQGLGLEVYILVTSLGRCCETHSKFLQVGTAKVPF